MCISNHAGLCRSFLALVLRRMTQGRLQAQGWMDPNNQLCKQPCFPWAEGASLKWLLLLLVESPAVRRMDPWDAIRVIEDCLSVPNVLLL